jgi:exopolysaccharide production protein ExoQ
MSVTAKVSFFAILAFLGGVGTVYAPAPTFAAVAAAFALSLWWFSKTRPSSSSAPEVFRKAEEGSEPRSTLTTKLVSGYLLIWWLALISPIAAYTPRGATSYEVAQSAAQGSLRNQALVFSFALIGSLFLPTAMRRFDPAFRWVAALWILYLGWALSSLLWTIYPPLTIRNVIAFILVSVGCFGLGTGFYGSHPNGRNLFLKHVFAAGVLSALVVLVPLPLRWGQYALLDPSFELQIGGDFPTYVSRPAMCALLVLIATSILQVRAWRRWDWIWVAILVTPVVLVLKTRGPALWAIVALGIFYLFYRVRIQDRVLQAGLLFALGVGTYIFYSEGALGPLILYLTRGNVEVAMTLTGRIPLWDVLLPEIGERPLLGAGFAAFWSPENVYLVEELVGFTAKSAHNGYLEELLNTGVVGLTILLAFLLYSMAVVRRRAREGDPFGWLALLFIIFYLLLNLTNSLIQDYLQIPFMVILMILGIMASKPTTGSLTTRSTNGMAREHVASPR